MNRIASGPIAFATLALTLFTLPESGHNRVEQPMTAPCLKELVLPGYPPLARQMLAQGDVSTRIHILANGTVGSVTVVDGHPLLAEPVRQSLMQWQFAPATSEFDLEITVRFSLTGPGKEAFPPQRIRILWPRLVDISTAPPPPLGPDVVPKRKAK